MAPRSSRATPPARACSSLAVVSSVSSRPTPRTRCASARRLPSMSLPFSSTSLPKSLSLQATPPRTSRSSVSLPVTFSSLSVVTRSSTP